MKQHVIVGSGLTGMAAALLLKKQVPDDKIIILEAQKAAAPLLMGFTRKGLHFDTGFHCAGGLRRGGILRQWLEHLDVWKHIGEQQLYNIGEEFRFGQEHKFSFAAENTELLPSLSQQFSQEYANNFSKFLSDIDEVIKASPYTNPHCLDLPNLSFENSKSLTEKLDTLSLPPSLLQMIKARCLLYGIDPHKAASFHDYALVGGLYFDSSHGILGGGKTLARAFFKSLAENNIHIKCNCAVTSIKHENKSLCALQLANGETLKAQSCIFSGHPAQLANIVEKGIFRPSFLEHINALEESAHGIIAFGVSQNPYLTSRAVYLLPSDYNAPILKNENFHNAITYIVGSKPEKPCDKGFPFMAILPQKLGIFTNLQKPRPQAYINFKQEKCQEITNYLNARIPELGAIKIYEAATSATMQDWIYGSRGSLYGVAHTTSSLPLLPITRMKNLFLAGQNILLPGILGGIVSAALACGFASDHSAVLNKFRQSINN